MLTAQDNICVRLPLFTALSRSEQQNKRIQLELHVFEAKPPKVQSRAAAGMYFKGKPRPHRALSVKRSNHSFEQLFFLSPATFSYHPLVPHQPDLLSVFMSWPVYRKLKLICPLPRAEIVGNPTVSELSNCFDSPLFFFFFPSPFPPQALETRVVYERV